MNFERYRANLDVASGRLGPDQVGVRVKPVEIIPLLNLEFLPEVPIAESIETDGVVFDYAADRRIVAIEILDASKRTTSDAVNVIDFSVVKSAA